MTLETASMIWLGVGAYLGVGLLFAVVFVFALAGRIDPAAQAMPLQARLIILPGVMLLWPLMLMKTFAQKEPPVS
ncbi:MAG: hypothetical protein AAFX03_13735 [Pseudomonadota bacterium]